MSQWRCLLMVTIMVTSILPFGEASEQGLRGIRTCEDGEICMEKNACPEYLSFLSLTGQAKQSAGQRLRGNICNKKPDKLCCKVKTREVSEITCEEGEICLEKKQCPEYFQFKSLTGKSKIMEGKRLSGKICNKKPDKLCCKKESKTSTPKTNGTTTQQSPQTCRQKGQSYSKSFLPAADQCGVSCSGTKSVVRGKAASLGEFPWAALLGMQKTTLQWDNRRKKWGNDSEINYHCGGTLINTWYVLTAAHCHTENTKIVEVVLGEWDVLTDPDCPVGEGGCDNPGVQRQEVEKVIIHSGYKEKVGPNDIALIEMKSEVKLNRFVQFSCLPLPEYNLQSFFYNTEKRPATVVGWGKSSNRPSPEELIYHGLRTKILQKGRVTINSMSECRMAYQKREIHSSQLCAWDPVNKADSCHGDSGGGLFLDSGDYPGQSQGNVHFQVGVVSYGTRLCGDVPGVYTRVEQFVPWIRENIGIEGL